MTRADVASLLRDMQMRNVMRHVTGLLLRIDNKFMQYIEGPVEVLRELQPRLESDPRQRDMVLLYAEPIEQRLFADWSMAFGDLSGPSLRMGPTGEHLQQVLSEPPPADGCGHEGDVFHRFWRECATSLPA